MYMKKQMHIYSHMCTGVCSLAGRHSTGSTRLMYVLVTDLVRHIIEVREEENG